MRKTSSVARPETLSGLFSKAAELGAFSGLSVACLGVFRAIVAKAGPGGRAETCRDSVAAQVGCCVKTVSRALAELERLDLLAHKKTRTGFVALVSVDWLRHLARLVDVVRAKARETLESVKDMRAAFSQAIESLRKGHSGPQKRQFVPRSMVQESFLISEPAPVPVGGHAQAFRDAIAACEASLSGVRHG